jgi:hypothetical protein
MDISDARRLKALEDHWDKDDYDVRLGDVERSSSWPHHAPLAGTRGTAVVLDDNRAG